MALIDTLFATQAWISPRRLQEAKASKKAVLRVRCLRSVSFIGSKGAFVSSLRTTEKVPLGEISGTFGGIPVEIGEQPMKVLIMSNMLGPWFGPDSTSRSCNHQWWRGAC